MYGVVDVCLFIIKYCDEKRYLISNLKLQKVLYFIQVYFLIKINKPCFVEKIEAWDFGPVVPKAYDEFKRFGGGSIPLVLFYYKTDKDDLWNIERVYFDEDSMSKKHKKMIKDVVDKLDEFSATDLVDITQKQAPWKDIYSRNVKAEITKENIKAYFVGKNNKSFRKERY